MSTKSIIRFKEEKNDGSISTLSTIYQHYDGYLDGVGIKLANWLRNKKILNGISFGISKEDFTYANGPGCLVAQFIKEFKTEIGGLYIYPEDCENQDYNYDVVFNYDTWVFSPAWGRPASECVKIAVSSFDEPPFFSGTIDEFIEYINSKW